MLEVARGKTTSELRIISELTPIKEKIQLFRTKYNCTLETFEEKINHKKEVDFAKWDSYIEWKVYVETKRALIKKMDQITDTHYIKIIDEQ
jgi:hypothetical protein